MMKLIRKIIGWILTILGGFVAVIAVVCVIVLPFGGLGLTFAFLFEGLIAAGICWLGMILKRDKTSKKTTIKNPTTKIVKQQENKIEKSPIVIETNKVKEYVIEKDKLGTCPFVEVPDLSKAIEVGSIGFGKTESHYTQNRIYVIHTPIDQVKFYYFDDGTLVFSGNGQTRSVDLGGYDGRNEYEPEPSPWSKTVEEGTTRLIVTEGIVDVGHGLISSLKNLKEINLANSVTAIHYNTARNVTILRAGKQMRRIDLFTGKLTEFQLPEAPVHIVYKNSGTLPTVTTDRPEIKAMIKDRFCLYFEEEMHTLFASNIEIAKAMSAMAYYAESLAHNCIFTLEWNSKYKNSRYVPMDDLWAIHGLPRNVKHQDHVVLNIENTYHFKNFDFLAALVHAKLLTEAKEIAVNIPSLGNVEAIVAWWSFTFPDVRLKITRSNKTTYQSLLSQKNPYERAKNGYEIPGPARTSVWNEESIYFIHLSSTNLIEELEWGQSEQLMVDTRDWQPYYMVLRYDGAVVA